jgi:polysaccharide chain length determinant protein (PEP-CTERM system associated)
MNIAALLRRAMIVGARHRWKALLLAWLICIPGWVAVYSLPSQYQSSARMYVDAEAILGALLRGIAVDSSPAAQVDMLTRTLLSRPNLERVIAKTDLDLRITDAASRDALIESLGKQIRITPQTRQLFRIEYSDRDPRLAYDVVRTLIELFMERAASNDRQQMQTARAFVAQQVATYEAQLREAEQRRAEFIARYVDILPSAGGGGSRLEAGRQKLQTLRGNLTDTERRRDILREQLAQIPATLAQAQAAAGAAGGGGDGRLAQAERQLRELLLRYTDQHPDVVTLRSVINELRAGGGGGGSATPRAPRAPAGTAAPAAGGPANPLYETIRLRLVDVEGEVASLQRQVREEEADVARLENLARTAPHVAAEAQNMDRDYAVLRKNYEELLARRESLQIAGAARTDAERVRLEVIDPPTVPTTPSGPPRLIFASAVLAVGLGAGVALVFLLIQIDRGFYSTHDLRGLGLPVLGGISSATPPPRRIFGTVVFAGGVAMLLLAFGAVLAGGPQLMARVPGLLARLVT